jgi:MFS family permease
VEACPRQAHPGLTLFTALSARSFTLLWSGQTLSRVGDHLYQVALAWWVLQTTGSASAMGTVLICSFTPMLVFLLLGGVAVDRFPRIRVMLASDLLRGVVLAAVTALAFGHLLTLEQVYVASLLFGLVDAFFQPAYTAVVPDLAPAEALSSANALTSLSQQIGPKSAPPWTPALTRHVARACGDFHRATLGRPLPSWLPRTERQTPIGLGARPALVDASQRFFSLGPPFALLHRDTRSDNLR